jgi:hypothetical protein
MQIIEGNVIYKTIFSFLLLLALQHFSYAQQPPAITLDIQIASDSIVQGAPAILKLQLVSEDDSANRVVLYHSAFDELEFVLTLRSAEGKKMPRRQLQVLPSRQSILCELRRPQMKSREVSYPLHTQFSTESPCGSYTISVESAQAVIVGSGGPVLTDIRCDNQPLALHVLPADEGSTEACYQEMLNRALIETRLSEKAGSLPDSDWELPAPVVSILLACGSTAVEYQIEFLLSNMPAPVFWPASARVHAFSNIVENADAEQFSRLINAADRHKYSCITRALPDFEILLLWAIQERHQQATELEREITRAFVERCTKRVDISELRNEHGRVILVDN